MRSVSHPRPRLDAEQQAVDRRPEGTLRALGHRHRLCRAVRFEPDRLRAVAHEERDDREDEQQRDG
jgi:hypothetical protein